MMEMGYIYSPVSVHLLNDFSSSSLEEGILVIQIRTVALKDEPLLCRFGPQWL